MSEDPGMKFVKATSVTMLVFIGLFIMCIGTHGMVRDDGGIGAIGLFSIGLLTLWDTFKMTVLRRYE